MTKSTSFKRILIVGGASFLGEALYSAACANYPLAQVFRTSRFTKEADRWMVLDPNHLEDIEKVLATVQPDLIVNAAGITAGTFHQLVEVNALSPMKIASVGGKVVPGVTLVLIGSAAEYGVSDSLVAFDETSPLLGKSMYAVSKICQTKLLPAIRQHVPRSIHVRLFNLFGQNMPDHLLLGRVRKIAERKLRDNDNTPIDVGFLGDFRDFIDVTVAAEYVLKLTENLPEVDTVNIGSGESLRVGDVLASWLERSLPESRELLIREKFQRAPNYSLANIDKLVSHVKLD